HIVFHVKYPYNLGRYTLEDFQLMPQTIGPVILDLMGLEITPEERELLQHPLAGGVILFARNYESPSQISQLCSTIREITPFILIAVDQEGGRVQRFKEGLITLPSMREIGEVYQDSHEKGLRFAYSSGWLMAAELLALGVDLSFAPVLDLDKGWNTVIGDRSFAASPAAVMALGEAVIQGMHAAGMAATGKHFPGHGSVKSDSHLELPVDLRQFTEIFQQDMQPFSQMISAGIDALMPAHILFSEVDDKPVGFSRYWLQEILRKKLNFSGIIFSDDLNMAGAEFAGNYFSRAEAALAAGCDMILICNNRPGAIEIMDHLSEKYRLSFDKFKRLKGKFSYDLNTLHASSAWKNNFNQYRKVYGNQ
ncbi:MAG TPA: beta-N-acetylhexosaminidase, partial [Gammaproteobacteria bacterium]|nr:beta-N-acetylhexosaminidase [Gammaproteobacteria bacterium]